MDVRPILEAYAFWMIALCSNNLRTRNVSSSTLNGFSR